MFAVRAYSSKPAYYRRCFVGGLCLEDGPSWLRKDDGDYVVQANKEIVQQVEQDVCGIKNKESDRE